MTPLQIKLFKGEAHTKVTQMFQEWVKEALKYATAEIEKEIIYNQEHAEEGWELAGERLEMNDRLNALCEQQAKEIKYLSSIPKKPLTPITVLNVPVRAQTVFNRLRLRSVGDLIAHTEDDLLRYRDFGKLTLNKLKVELTKHGYSLKKKQK